MNIFLIQVLRIFNVSVSFLYALALFFLLPDLTMFVYFGILTLIDYKFGKGSSTYKLYVLHSKIHNG